MSSGKDKIKGEIKEGGNGGKREQDRWKRGINYNYNLIQSSYFGCLIEFFGTTALLP